MEFLKRAKSIVWSIFRLIFIVPISILSALHLIIFEQSEVVTMNLLVRPQGPEREKLSYIDKLCANNAELVKGGTIPKADQFDPDDPFIPDDLYDLDDLDDMEDINFDEDDGDEGEPPSNGKGKGKPKGGGGKKK